MHSVSDLSVVKAINCKIDGPHTVFKIRVQKTDDPTKEFFVNRRFKEFEDLKNELSKAFKNIDDAPFPKKSKFGVSRDEKSQNKRRETLDAFLKACLATKDAIKNPFFLKFLQLSDSKPVLRVSLAEGRDLFEYAQEDVLQPFWQIALCTDKEFTKASPHTIVTDTLDAQKRSTHTWTDEVYEMVLADSDIYGIRLNLYNAKTDAIRASVKIPLNTISVNHPTTHRFPLVPAIPGAHSVVGDVQLTLEVQNASAPKSILPGVEITDGVKNVKLLQQKHRELLKEERKDAPGGSLHVNLSYTPPVGSWDGPLLVRIIEARELVGNTFAPYVTVSWLNESKSTLVNAGQNPLFNQTFQFLLKKEDILSSVGMLRFGVWNMLEGKSNLLAMADFALEDVLPVLDSPNQPVEKDMWLPLSYPAAPVVDLLTQSKYAKLMQEQGYRPKYPIVLIPGLASSALEVLEGKKDWVGSRVWISINKLTKTRVNLMWKKFTDNINSIGDSVKNMFTKQDREDGIDKAQVNNWIEHMALAEDCKSDPPGVKVRNVSGTAGITYLEADSMIGKKYTYVCGPLVKNLVEFGYVENETLFAFPYDWRIPFAYLEARDGFFTTLKKNIEEIVAKQRLPVVIFGHSMGCRITHYFLNWVRNSAGQKWVDDHVHTFVAVGAPWLGAPKILRGTISGELMGMDPFLNNKQAIRLSRSFGSSPSLYPIDPQLFFQDPAKKFIYLREEKGTNNPNAAFITEKGGYNTVEQMQMLNMAGAVNQAKLLTEYLNDPAFGENKTLGVKHMMLEPPPVKNLVSVYGVDLETQLMYFYIYNAKKKRYDLANYNGVMADIGIKIKDGVGYETPETIQKCNQSLTGYTTMRSGDGTVPYASLSYCYHWRNKIENLKVIELNQAQHRDIVSTIKFFEIFIDVVAEKPIQDLKSSSKISLSNLSGMFGQLAFGNNAQLNVSDTLKKSNASAASLDTENPTNMSVSVDMPASDF